MRSSTESKTPPNFVTAPVLRASAPSSRSSALKSSITTPAQRKYPPAASAPAATLPLNPATEIMLGVTPTDASGPTIGSVIRLDTLCGTSVNDGNGTSGVCSSVAVRRARGQGANISVMDGAQRNDDDPVWDSGGGGSRQRDQRSQRSLVIAARADSHHRLGTEAGRRVPWRRVRSDPG